MHCEADQVDSAHTLATHSISDLMTARSLCRVADTAAPCRGKYQSARISVTSIKHLTNIEELTLLIEAFHDFG